VRRVLDLLGSLVLATIVLAALLVVRPISRELSLHLYLVALAAIAMAGALSATNAAMPRARRSGFEDALRRRPAPPIRPAQLERTERAVTLGVANAYDFHARLRPILREVAATRLGRARGVELDSPAGRDALGEDAWDLLRPDREPPDARYGPGLEAQRLRALVAMLEDL
jgi:hypothetical protein